MNLRVFVAFLGVLCIGVSSSNADIASTKYVDDRLPVVNDATLTIQRNGATVGTFTANASSPQTVNIDVSKVRVGASSTNTTLADMWIE
ncbi:MAG: hypothetical protein ACLRFJ_00095 [Alphaproteobacteria bacterium]